jgi:serine/threonine protein kinase
MVDSNSHREGGCGNCPRPSVAHGLGLLHGGLKASNILFDADRRIQIADFSPIRLETGAVELFSGEE